MSSEIIVLIWRVYPPTKVCCKIDNQHAHIRIYLHVCGGGGVWIDVERTRRNVLTRNIHKHTIFDVFAASLYIGGGGCTAAATTMGMRRTYTRIK